AARRSRRCQPRTHGPFFTIEYNAALYRLDSNRRSMNVDLFTLYLLAIGTLLASAVMMFWEHRTRPKRSYPQRSRELRLFSAGLATLAIGCAAALLRHDFHGALGSAISNLIILSGYLLVLAGIACLCRRQHRTASFALLIVMALVWVVCGGRWQEAVWSYASALPIALVNAMMVRDMWRCDAMKAMPARRIVIVVAGIHALLYASRAFILPGLTAAFGVTAQAIASKLTIYEGVLYSVILPMALLKLVRDEAHTHLLWESQTDYLTRLGNRRWFFEEGKRIMGAEERRGALSILAFDLDRFKAINDRYGHATGDEVLKSFAETARSVLGSDAILARIGGEEFAALLVDADAQRAKALGEAVVAHFAEEISKGASGIGTPVTVSVGLAQFDGEAPPFAEGLAAADRALYRAKSLGGNRLEAG
ncbi:MAG TPA: GGDEF domain-containing protein, partial [Oxalicibacterium sp.]|nr:GGDEF domain-containing protein [Oxalicibacterium sp.]